MGFNSGFKGLNISYHIISTAEERSSVFQYWCHQSSCESDNGIRWAVVTRDRAKWSTNMYAFWLYWDIRYATVSFAFLKDISALQRNEDTYTGVGTGNLHFFFFFFVQTIALVLLQFHHSCSDVSRQKQEC